MRRSRCEGRPVEETALTDTLPRLAGDDAPPDSSTRTPVVDLNGCLLPYLTATKDADPYAAEGIGCSILRLLEGHVKIQVLPILAGIEPSSSAVASRQLEAYERLLSIAPEVRPLADPAAALRSPGIAVVPAIESATCLCAESEELDVGLARFDRISNRVGRLLYVTLVRHGENRFGGGSDTRVGLKDDGRAILRHIAGRKVALDLSHASEPLAREALEYIEVRDLDLAVLVSHANFESVWPHAGNVSDRVAREVIRRGGLIGLNLIRRFVHDEDPDTLYRHLEHALELGGGEALAWGADYFHWPAHPDLHRRPFYFAEHEHAGRFPSLLAEIEGRFGGAVRDAVAHGNAVRFISRLWS